MSHPPEPSARSENGGTGSYELPAGRHYRARRLALDQLRELDRCGITYAGELVPRLLHLGRLNEELGEYDAALSACATAADLAACAIDASRDELRARSLAALIGVYRARGELGSATGLRSVAETHAKRASPSAMAEVLIELGRVSHDLGEHETAQRQLHQALTIAEAECSERLRADALEALGALACARGRYQEAEGLLQQALELAHRHDGPESIQVAGVLNALGMVAKYSGRFDDGRRHYERALSILTRRIGSHAPDIAAIYHNLGGLEHARRDFAAAEPYARTAVTIRERALGPTHIAVAADKAALAAILDALGHHDQAATSFREAIATFERALGPDHHEVAVNLNNLAAVLQRQGRLDEAEQLYKQAIAASARSLGPDHPETALTLNNLAVNYKRQARPADAERTFKLALERLAGKVEPDHPAFHTCIRNYARLLRDLHRDDEAARLVVPRGCETHRMTIEIPPAGSRGTKAPPSGPVASAMMAVVRRVHKLTGNKMSGQPLLYLHTVGAKSGQPRTAAVMAFAEGDDTWLVVASRGGTAGHPSWLYNIAAHPDRIEVEIDGHKTAVTASTLSGEERTDAWKRITTSQPRFSGYEAKTDREIPVVRLAAR